jgi:hypothetical protein
MRFSKFSTPLLLASTILAANIANASGSSLLLVKDDFDARGMMRPGPGQTSPSASFSGAQPGRFSMQQSYSLTAMSGSAGSVSSGLYLNTLNYQFSPTLTASADVGFFTPIHSSMPGVLQGGAAGSVVFPRMGLEYRPSDRLTMHLELFNGQDAWKAYGGMPWSTHFFQGSRTP